MNIEQYLSTHDSLVYSNKGVSMLPMLRQGRDLMIVRRKREGERLKKYDVAIYIRPPHDYVLHRIIRVDEGGYVFLGDNCENKEYGIREEQVIAVMTAFVHKGKQIDVTDKGYIFYSRFWYLIYPIRRATRRSKRFIKKILRKLTGRK